MVKFEDLEKYTEKSGVTTDKKFDEITELLRKLPVVEENTYGDTDIGVVSTVYATSDGQYVRLTYQVRTPNTPKNMEYTYYFGEA